MNILAIANANSTRNGSIGSNLVSLEVIIIQDPPTPPSASKSFSKSFSNDPDGLVASFNLINKSTTRKIDNIIKKINQPDTHNNEQNENKEDSMLVMTGSSTMD